MKAKFAYYNGISNNEITKLKISVPERSRNRTNNVQTLSVQRAMLVLMSDTATTRRLVENEILARTGNRNAGKAISNLSVKVASILFFCECSKADCPERIPMSQIKYTAVHEQNNRFMIKPEHATSSVESVIAREPNYWVVQKFKMDKE